MSSIRFPNVKLKLRTGLLPSEQAIVNEANTILSSSEFSVIKDAFAKGIPAEIRINGRLVQYEPGWTFSEAMTLHESGGFLMGPKAFASTSETGKTLIHELYRLRTQNTGQLGVDVTKLYTEAAAAAAEKLSPYLKN